MAKKIYKILTAVDHDLKRYEPDSSITLDDDTAAPLLSVNAIEFVEDAPDSLDVPTDPKIRLSGIMTAIGQLDPNNGDLWLRDGKPDTSAIVAITGWPVSAAERTAAWLQMQS
jgi:hypothetical protein